MHLIVIIIISNRLLSKCMLERKLMYTFITCEIRYISDSYTYLTTVSMKELSQVDSLELVSSFDCRLRRLIVIRNIKMHVISI